ncbi:hypothetical protein ACVWY0_001915 [Arthrobacter sp. UYNi723]
MVNNMTDSTDVSDSPDITPEGLLAGIRESRLVGIVRGTDGPAAAQSALAAMAEGFRFVEIALTTPGRWRPSARSAPPHLRAATSAAEPS